MHCLALVVGMVMVLVMAMVMVMAFVLAVLVGFVFGGGWCWGMGDRVGGDGIRWRFWRSGVFGGQIFAVEF